MIRLSPDIPAEARAWRNEPIIHNWCRQNHLISSAQQEDWLKKIETDPSVKMFAVMDIAESLDEMHRDPKGDKPHWKSYDLEIPVGVCGLTSLSLIHRSAEFSLYIAPGYLGNGYAKPALLELLKYGFIQLGLNRIWGEVFAGNPALAIFKDLGFIEEGVCRQSYYKGGTFINSHIISILRGEYDDLYKAPAGDDLTRDPRDKKHHRVAR